VVYTCSIFGIAPTKWFTEVNAGIAQLVEQLICNQQVVGSNPTAGSIVNQGGNPKRVTTCLATSWTLLMLQRPENSSFSLARPSATPANQFFRQEIEGSNRLSGAAEKSRYPKARLP
jgi:hypothetical protein